MASREELAAGAIAALNDRDLEALRRYIDPELVFNSRLVALGGDVYRGIEGMRQYFDDVDSTWNGFDVDIDEFHDLGERAVVVIRARGRGKASGVPLDQQIGQVWTWRGDRLHHVDAFEEPAEAFRVAKA